MSETATKAGFATVSAYVRHILNREVDGVPDRNPARRGLDYQSPAQVFFGTDTGKLHALNAKTGKPSPGFEWTPRLIAENRGRRIQKFKIVEP